MTKITYIPGEIANAAIDEYGNRKPVTRTQHIFDDAKSKSQAEVNADIDDTLALHQSEINALNSQNYVTVDSFSNLPDTGAVDTVYRVSNWDGTQQDPSAYSEYAWNGSQYVHLSTKTQIGEVFDISAYHATGGTLATYADLSAALDSNNGSGVPQSLQKGGMSVKFVQSSDNKYVQYRLMADEFTTDTTQWAIADECVYVENPEYVYIKTDAEGKILWAIKADGNIYYGAGCPQQVVDYINEKIAELSLDEYEDIVAFLNGLEEGDKTLQDLLDEKVNKEEGKSLIDAEYANGVRYIENPEFTEVKVDNEDRILEATEKDGTKLFGGNVKILGSIDISGVSYKVVSNPEWLEVVLDAEDRIICGIRTDGKFYVYAADFLNDLEAIKARLKELDAYSVTENPEFIEVELDVDDKILGGRKIDGTKFENNDVELNGNATVGGSLEVDGFVIKNMEDTENRSEITLDSEEKIISYRKGNGTLVENVGIETPNVNAENISAKEVNIEGGEATLDSLELTEQGMTDFQQALKNSGFKPGGGGDYTDKESMYISEPRLAYLNIISNVILENLSKEGSTGAIEGVNYNVPVMVEYNDNNGNYFKKYALLSGQGRSSLSFKKKGLSFDFFNEDPNAEDFDEDNVFSMKFGDWVPQDSFHVKSYYTDWPRCTTPVVYKLTDEVVRTRGVMNDRPYKKYYVGEYSDAANANTQSDLDKNMETGARCFPDGFPVIVYQNGEFWGVNAWQLKKHRDNYQQSKKKATNIHLDGDMGSHNGSTPFWLWNGTIDWSIYCSGTYGIETRNPKNLYCVDGKKYDADTHDAEIIDTATAEEWIAAGKIIPTDKPIDDTLAGYLRTTGKVRASIEELTTYVPTINQMISDGATAEEIRATIEDMFDVNSFIDYIVIGNVCGNNDAWDNNGQIVTWGKLEGSDRLNWSVNMYDCDITFGCCWNGISASAANNNKLGSTYPLYKIFWDYYYDELKARYHELRDKGIFDADHITQLFRGWMNRVGYDNYTKEYEKWNESPCFRDGSQVYVNNPTTGGFYGSIERIYLWIKKRIQYMDAVDFFNYNQQ